MFVQSVLFIFTSSIIAGSLRVSLIIGCGGAEDLRAWWRAVIFYLRDICDHKFRKILEAIFLEKNIIELFSKIIKEIK